MRDGFLEPRTDLGDGAHRFFGQISVHLVTQPQIDTAIPQPANPDINFAVVNLLKLNCEISSVVHNQLLSEITELNGKQLHASSWRRVELAAVVST